MADKNTPGASGIDPLEKEKTEALRSYLKEVQDFLGFDKRFNEQLLRIVTAAAGHAEANPGDFFSSKSFSDLASMIQGRADAPGGSGGDIVGGGILDGLIQLLETLGKIAEVEKKFFFRILALIFCGCDCICPCPCE